MDGNSSDEEEKGVNPEKVNWMKYIFRKHVKPDDQFYQTLNRPEVTSAVLELLLSNKTDEEIQGDLMDLLGSERFEMLIDLIGKRKYIQDYCDSLAKSILNDKRKQNTGHNPHQYSVGVSVSFGDSKGKKGKKKPKEKQNKDARQKVTNHELLEKLGFSAEFVEENRMLGLKQRNQGDYLLQSYENPYSGTRRRAREFRGGAGDRKVGYKQDTFDEPDWKEIHLTPPKKQDSQAHELISIKSLPEWMRPAFQNTENLNTIQSIVFDSAFNSTNNVLVAAPTGAGKTNIALLTILREVKQYAIQKPGKPHSYVNDILNLLSR